MSLEKLFEVTSFKTSVKALLQTELYLLYHLSLCARILKLILRTNFNFDDLRRHFLFRRLHASIDVGTGRHREVCVPTFHALYANTPFTIHRSPFF